MLASLLSLLAGSAAAAPAVLDARGEIVVDGVLDEPEWAEAEPATEFLRFQPIEGGPAPGSTEVRFVQDERYLYVGIRVRDAGYPIRARITPREDINQDDQVGVYLDTYRDERTGYIFYFNPLGIQQDIRHNNGSWNVNWDIAYRSRGRVIDDGEGFEVEIALPWRALRYPADPGPQEWGVLLTRKIPREGAKYSYPVQERNHPRLFTQAAPLTGVRPGKRGTALELVPALTAVQSWPRDDVPPRQAFEGVDPVPQVVRPSLDLRYGVTPDVGLTATVNPDFSQVEADQFDVRTDPRFAFQFPERRPFFLDGIEFFQDRMDTLYTRSIAEPVYGLKLGGRQGPVSVGVLNAIDRSPVPSFHERGTPGFDADDIGDRWASNSLLRVRGDAFGSGYVGMTLADKRVLGAEGHFDAAGADVAVPLGDRWILAGSSLHSLWGDQGDLRWGTDTEAAITRSGGLGWGTSVSGRHRTDDFRNEMGFLNQSGLTNGSASLQYTFEPGGAVDTATPSIATSQTYELEGDFVRSVGVGQAVLVRGIHDLSLNARADQFRQGRVANDPDPVELTGGSLDGGYRGQVGKTLNYDLGASASRTLQYYGLVEARTAGASGGLTVRPTVSTVFDLSGSVERRMVRTTTAQEVWSGRVRLRTNVQFSRELGLRVVEELGASDAVAFTDFEDLAARRGLLSSVLLTWLQAPGTAAYLGYTENTDLLDGEPVARTVFAKVSVLFRP